VELLVPERNENTNGLYIYVLFICFVTNKNIYLRCKHANAGENVHIPDKEMY